VGRPPGPLAVLGLCACLPACLSPPSAPGSRDDGGPPRPDAAPQADEHLIGNVLFLTFDDDLRGHAVRDRSGRGHHGHSSRQPRRSGVYGQAYSFAANDPIHLGGHPELFSERLTVEAWVNASGTGTNTILSNHQAIGGNDQVELGVALIRSGDAYAIELTSNDDGQPVTTQTSPVVPVSDWTHVAITWDRTRTGDNVEFFVDGASVLETSLAPDPVELAEGIYWVGNRPSEGARFVGSIDELKVSDHVKTPEQIRASMEFDSAGEYPVCGDGVIEESEPCEVGDPCCEGCATVPDGTMCPGGRTCAQGRCTGDDPVRAADGLVALYEFEEGAELEDGHGNLDLEVGDGGGQEPPPAAGGVLDLDGTYALVSPGPASPIIDACMESDELTVEAWVVPGEASVPTEKWPARIVTVSESAAIRSVTLGQDGGGFAARITSTHASANGLPGTRTEGGVQVGVLTHLVLTRAPEGERRLYVDGRLRDTSQVGGRLEWDPSHSLAIGDELGEQDRSWLGQIHLIAIYCRALSPLEVADHFAIGSGD